MTLFQSEFNKIHEQSRAGLHTAQYIFNHFYCFNIFHFCKNGFQFSLMTVLIAKRIIREI